MATLLLLPLLLCRVATLPWNLIGLHPVAGNPAVLVRLDAVRLTTASSLSIGSHSGAADVVHLRPPLDETLNSSRCNGTRACMQHTQQAFSHEHTTRRLEDGTTHRRPPPPPLPITAGAILMG